MRFRYRLTITIVLLVALTFAAGGAVLIGTSFESSLEERTKASLDSYFNVRNTLYLLNSMGDQRDYEGIVEAMKKMGGPWRALQLSRGQEILFRGGDAYAWFVSVPLPMTSQYGYVYLPDKPILQVTGTIRMGEEDLLLQAQYDMSDVSQARRQQVSIFQGIYLVVVLLGAVAAGVLSRVMTQRLDRLTRAAKRVSLGDLSARSNIRTNDEFGQLSRTFDGMNDRLQENIQQLSTQMQRQEAFMGAFAHELKTPMTAIIGYADLLRQGGLEEDVRMSAADYIYSEGSRLEKLSFKLLDLLLLEKDKAVFKEVNLSAFMDEIERALAPVLEKRGVALQCRGVRGKVWMEPDLVKSLVYNLVDNGAKAMDEGGTITVKGVKIPNGCEIAVTDSGRGMAPEELSRITEAFYRVDKSRARKQGGAGLGLALCRRIVELHGGGLRFESQPGQGTTATVTLYEGGRQDG